MGKLSVMSQSPLVTSMSPSKVWLPVDSPAPTIFDFMVKKFPSIDKPVWQQRFVDGKVLNNQGQAVPLQSPFIGGQHITYFREVAFEKRIPFDETIIFQNENLMVVDKPHFLPVHPSGKYVNETLVNRLRQKKALPELVAAHRLDRLTAGLVLCILRKEIRGVYQKMFEKCAVKKTYLAVGKTPPGDKKQWFIKNRLTPLKPHFLMRVSDGRTNSESTIKILRQKQHKALFELEPVTGKKHQLRVHMVCIGSGIVNDPLYPGVVENRQDDYSQPMQLLAHKLTFRDPLSNMKMEFVSSLKLDF